VALASEWASISHHASHHSSKASTLTTSSSLATPTTTFSSASPASFGEVLHHVLDELRSWSMTSSWASISEKCWVLFNISFNISFSWSIFINGGEYSSWCLFWSIDLDERM
jgi:hypothetical protein